MMKQLITASTIVIFLSCQSGSKSSSISDSIDKRLPVQSNWSEDSFQARIKRAKTSDIDLSSPIKILSYKLNNNEVQINFQNSGHKKVSVIVFSFRILDAFGESSQEIKVNVDRTISIGQKSVTDINIPIRNARKIIDLNVSKIAFSDGSKW